MNELFRCNKAIIDGPKWVLKQIKRHKQKQEQKQQKLDREWTKYSIDKQKDYKLS